jgi:hypothetical protein
VGYRTGLPELSPHCTHRHTSVKMPIQPLITFKAGICEVDVSFSSIDKAMDAH